MVVVVGKGAAQDCGVSSIHPSRTVFGTQTQVVFSRRVLRDTPRAPRATVVTVTNAEPR